MRTLLAGLLLLLLPVGAADAESIPLVIDPVTPRANEPITLTATSPLDEQGHAMIEISVSNLWEDVVDVQDDVIQVSSYSRPRPPGSVVQHALAPLHHSIDLGMLAAGDYTVQFDLYGESGALLGSGAAAANVAPEPAGAAIGAMGAALVLARRRRRSPS